METHSKKLKSLKDKKKKYKEHYGKDWNKINPKLRKLAIENKIK